VYVYGLEDGAIRAHLGAGLGAAATARALRADIADFVQRRTAPPAVTAGARRSVTENALCAVAGGAR
jgi:hypothetical protein